MARQPEQGTGDGLDAPRVPSGPGDAVAPPRGVRKRIARRLGLSVLVVALLLALPGITTAIMEAATAAEAGGAGEGDAGSGSDTGTGNGTGDPDDPPVEAHEPVEPLPTETSAAAPGEGDGGEPLDLLRMVLFSAAAGIAHEVLHSGGVIVLPRRTAKGHLHLGTLSGALVGGLAGWGAFEATGGAGNFLLAVTSGFAMKGTVEGIPRLRHAADAAREAAAGALGD